MVEDRRRPIDAEHPVVVHGEGGSDEIRGAELTVSGPILSSSATAAESSPNVVQVDALRTGETSHERRKDRERAPWLRSYGRMGGSAAGELVLTRLQPMPEVRSTHRVLIFDEFPADPGMPGRLRRVRCSGDAARPLTY